MNTITAASQPQPSRFWLTLVIIGLGSLALAAAFILVSQRSTPFILTSGVIGLCASFVVSYAIWQGRMRGLLLCLALAVLLTILTYSLFHLGNYLIFRQAQAAFIASQRSLSPAQISALIDDTLRQNTGSDGFLGYLKLMLNTGIIVRSGMMGPADQVTGSKLLFYWLLDAGFILFGAVVGAWMAARRSFCENCNRYYGRITVTTGDFGLLHLGWLTQQDGAELGHLCNAEHFEAAGALLKPDKPKPPSLDVFTERCPTCETNPVVVSVFRTPGKLSTRRNLYLRRSLAPEEFSRFTAFSNLPPPKSTLSGSDTGWFLSMLGAAVFLIALLLVYGLI